MEGEHTINCFVVVMFVLFIIFMHAYPSIVFRVTGDQQLPAHTYIMGYGVDMDRVTSLYVHYLCIMLVGPATYVKSIFF